ncbi:D-glycero-beta-D-manno-heptose 1-phosphate adenylyltransferase [Gandjariella thermophila]|uniref:D-glycero-beta-D-manno-heptose 1-phosphate adenylyltransferase n=1 Tax=Gandjariella thermophila TaxID=1931992 RepID=A0A4D4JGC1_9PSEU|nr:D-glycero-beta-D-manno-heptose 1-phosphate adenylyltransferase [Gandjariella thermophila]GDY33369.1 bifunctional protein HldE [Gandjariella thermophila]
MSGGPLVVVGDALLDADIEGTADRLCPEAPVPVVDVAREWHRPGGAGLAALLAARSAAEVVLVTAVGDDPAGRRLAQLLAGEAELVRLPARGATVCKTRVRAADQSLVRFDSGDARAGGEPLGPRAAEVLRGAGAILVADYGRGLTGHPDLRRLLAEVAPRIPVVWDPHPRGAAPVPGLRLATPNQSEAAGFAGHDTAAEQAAMTLRERWGCTGVAVTVGSRGALLAVAGEEPARRVPVPSASRVTGSARPDTCGAGDRFATAATAALLDGASVAEAVTGAVDAAARFVAAGGATALSVPAEADTALSQPRQQAGAPRDAFELAARVRRAGGRLVATGGCFDLLHAGHVSLLRRARALGDALVVCLNSDASVRRLKGAGRPIVPAEDRARLLTELESVDAVVTFEESSPEALLDRLRPDVWVKGGDYADTDLPEAATVRRHGGDVVLIPTVAGYSTTRIVAAAQAGA